jgi:hypothetical protein
LTVRSRTHRKRRGRRSGRRSGRRRMRRRMRIWGKSTGREDEYKSVRY